jgi:hydrogenase maturation factor
MSSNMDNSGAMCTAVPQSALNELIERLENLSERAHNTVDRVYEKLDGVCMPNTPNKDIEKGMIEREYPQYFSQMRVNLNSIENALQRLDGLMARCEV